MGKRWPLGNPRLFWLLGAALFLCAGTWTLATSCGSDHGQSSVRESPEATPDLFQFPAPRHTAPDVMSALRSIQGAWCPHTIPAHPPTPALRGILIGPHWTGDEWRVQCNGMAGTGDIVVAECFSLRDDTLEIIDRQWAEPGEAASFDCVDDVVPTETPVLPLSPSAANSL